MKKKGVSIMRKVASRHVEHCADYNCQSIIVLNDLFLLILTYNRTRIVVGQLTQC